MAIFENWTVNQGEDKEYWGAANLCNERGYCTHAVGEDYGANQRYDDEKDAFLRMQWRA